MFSVVESKTDVWYGNMPWLCIPAFLFCRYMFMLSKGTQVIPLAWHVDCAHECRKTVWVFHSRYRWIRGCWGRSAILCGLRNLHEGIHVYELHNAAVGTKGNTTTYMYPFCYSEDATHGADNCFVSSLKPYIYIYRNHILVVTVFIQVESDNSE